MRSAAAIRSAPGRRRFTVLLAMLFALGGCELPHGQGDPALLAEPAPGQGAGGGGVTPLLGGVRRGSVREDLGTPSGSRALRLALSGRRVLPTVTGNRQVRLDYSNTDAARLVREVMRDVLNLPVQIDPSVTGAATLVTTAPIPISEVPQRLDEALRPLGLGIAAIGGTVRAGRIAELEAAGGGQAQEMRMIPLATAGPAQVIAAVQPNLPEGVRLQPTPDGRALMATGPLDGVNAVQDLVQLFDSDVLRGRSFGLYPLSNASPASVAQGVSQILAGVQGVTVMPVQRSNAVLVVADRPEVLQRARRAIQQLDVASDGGTTLQVVPVMNRRAGELADVLNRTFGTASGAPVARSSPAGAFGGLSVGSADSGSGVGTRVPGASASPAPATGLPDRPPESTGDAPAAAGGQPLWEQLGFSAPVRIQADPGRNALLVLAAPGDAGTVLAAIRRLDLPQRQVFIEAVIAEVTLTDQLRYGINFSYNFGDGILSQLAPLLTASTSLGGLSLVLKGSNATGLLQALSGVTDVRVVSAPRLLVLDNETATLQVGNQIPILTRTQQSTDNPNAPLVNSVEMRDTGVILAVRPRVGAGGAVTLDLFQEVSDATQTDSSTINSPTIQLRRLQSTISAHSGDTIALGGLMQDKGNRGQSGVPVLSRLPVVGGLFGTRDQSNTRSELLVLLTPRLVDSTPDMRGLVEELRGRLGALAPEVANSTVPPPRGAPPPPPPPRGVRLNVR